MKKKYTWRILGLVACLLFGLVAVSCHKEEEITEEQARIVMANAEVVMDNVSQIYEASETVEEMAQHLDEIKAMANVEDVRLCDGSILIKIKEGGILSYEFFPDYGSKNSVLSMRNGTLNQINSSAAKDDVELCENKSLCVVNAVPYDENVNFIKADLEDVANKLRDIGFNIRYVTGEDVDVDFICNEMPNYGVVVLQAHGEYEDGQHWIITGNSSGLSYGLWSFQYFREWLSDLRRVSISKERRNGNVDDYHYWKISEDYIDDNMEKHFSNNSIMFAISCSLLETNSNLWNILRKKNLGCFLGYDKPVRAEVGSFALSSVMNSMCNGKTVSEAYQSVPANGRHDNYTGANLVLCPANSDIILVEKEPVGDDWVDLGLPSGLLWATRNVGASSPEDYGEYFAWGEIQTKEVYNWSTYRYCNGDYDQLTKYCNHSDYGYNGFTDNLTILQPGDDAATANYGGRTPTEEEWVELLDNTTATWTTQNGVNGRRFTGPNGNSLFLPATGYRRGDTSSYTGGLGYFWSSSLNNYYPDGAWIFYFGSDGQFMFYHANRCDGHPVRAVRSTR